MTKSSIVFLVFLSFWVLTLMLLFPPSVIGFFISVILYLLICGFSIWTINRYKSKHKRILVSLMCMLLSAYGITALHPAQHTKPLSEIRAAAGATFRYDSLSPLLLYELPEPPFATNTAVLHRNQSESVDYAIQFSFDDENENSFLITVANDNVGSSYAGLLDAEINHEILSIKLVKDDRIDSFNVPLETNYNPIELSGLHENLSVTAQQLYTKIHPSQTFQKAFWKFLDVVYPSY